jgi:hypothetical protein
VDSRTVEYEEPEIETTTTTYEVRAGRGVAVVWWEWYRWIEEVKAVRMVLDRAWQWQYWPRFGGLKKERKKREKSGGGEVAGYS